MREVAYLDGVDAPRVEEAPKQYAEASGRRDKPSPLPPLRDGDVSIGSHCVFSLLSSVAESISKILSSGNTDAYQCVLPIDPATLSTAQQKKISFRSRRVFTNKRVAAGMKVIRRLAEQHTSRVLAAAPFGSSVAFSATYHYSYPKNTPRKRLVDGAPMPVGADLDNRNKAVMDALTQAGWWPDDRYVTDLHLRKRRTTGSPRIEISVAIDPSPPPMPESTP